MSTPLDGSVRGKGADMHWRGEFWLGGTSRRPEDDVVTKKFTVDGESRRSVNPRPFGVLIANKAFQDINP